MNTDAKDLGVEVDGEGLLTDRNLDYRSPLERIGDYGRSLGRAIAGKKKEIALTTMLGTAIAGGVAGCSVNKAARALKDYGTPIRETAPIISEDGTRDFWRLTEDEYGNNYWVHYIDRPGHKDDISAYKCRGEPKKNPPERLDKIMNEAAENFIKKIGGF